MQFIIAAVLVIAYLAMGVLRFWYLWGAFVLLILIAFCVLFWIIGGTGELFGMLIPFDSFSSVLGVLAVLELGRITPKNRRI